MASSSLSGVFWNSTAGEKRHDREKTEQETAVIVGFPTLS